MPEPSIQINVRLYKSDFTLPGKVKKYAESKGITVNQAYAKLIKAGLNQEAKK